jgi:flavorubredoxin
MPPPQSRDTFPVTMQTRIDPVGEDTYRIATFDPTYNISFNQFLIVDEQPALIHTGTYQAYDSVRAAIAQVIDPKKLAYVVIPHFEADECGGMRRFVNEAPGCTLIASELGAALNLSGWEYVGPFKGVRDGETLELGKHRLRFLETPHVHHWDSMMVIDETTNALFPADLFLQPGEQTPLVRENFSKEMCQLYRESGIFAAREPVVRVVDRVERFDLEKIHPMHGGSLVKEILPRYFDALRTQRFWFDNMVFGRKLPT